MRIEERLVFPSGVTRNFENRHEYARAARHFVSFGWC